MQLQISRYNPIFRDSEGRYPTDLWTSVYDIGRKNGPTAEAYLQVETLYWLTLESILISAEVDVLEICDLEEHCTPKEVEKSNELVRSSASWCQDHLPVSQIKLANFRPLFEAMMREVVWCSVSSSEKVKFHFSHDLYLIVNTPLDLSWTELDDIWVDIVN